MKGPRNLEIKNVHVIGKGELPSGIQRLKVHTFNYQM